MEISPSFSVFRVILSESSLTISPMNSLPSTVSIFTMVESFVVCEVAGIVKMKTNKKRKTIFVFIVLGFIDLKNSNQ